ncbi:unnamed protein product [Lymnaea stagnalis]|uniref:Endothelin-converting enzyme 1 n=1 Tax=Lymnaea stagnalis TaxID=6523 RepID=A0AAV2IND5_LYMST
MQKAPAQESNLMYYLCVLCVLSIIISILSALIYHKSMELVPQFLEAEKHCVTPNCLQNSAHFLSMVDPKVKPCDDMYLHSCGGWMKKHAIPTDYGKWNQIGERGANVENILLQILESNENKLKGTPSTAIGKLKTYYRSCIDVKTIDAKAVSRLSTIIKSFGSWTITSNGLDAWDEATWSLQSVMEKVAPLDLGAFFSVEMYPDMTDGTRFLPVFTSGLFTSNPLFLLADDGLSEVMRTSSHALEKFDPTFDPSKLSEVLEFEKKLMQLKNKYEWMPLRQASQITLGSFLASFGTWIDLKKYLKIFYSRDIPADTPVYCTSLEFYKELDKVISATNKELLANYIIWHVFSKFRGSANFVNVNEESRWKTCLGTLREHMGHALSAPFVEDYFPIEVREQITSMFTKIKSQFSQNVKRLKWMDKLTSEMVLKKLEAMSISSGYPDWILQSNKLDDFYKAYNVTNGELLYSHLSLVQQSHAQLAKDTLSKFDKTQWLFSPDVVKVVYHRFTNVIVVTAAFLYPAEQILIWPTPYVYGAIGFAIAHEMTHAFDNDGIMLDENGKKMELPSMSAADFFKDSPCFIDHYSSYNIEGFPLNGLETLSENVADSGGLMLAYKAAKEEHSNAKMLPGLNYTLNQLFFIGYSQAFCAVSEPPIEALLANHAPHAPERIRVNGSLSGSVEFLAAFSCHSGAKTKCKVW